MSTNDDGRSDRSWWQTLPGVLTAVAALVTAITGLIVGLSQAGILRGSDNAASDPIIHSSAPTSQSPQPPIHPKVLPPKPSQDGYSGLAPATDSATVVAISPAAGTPLSGNIGHSITMKIRYRLESAKAMILAPTAEGFDDDGCASTNHRTIGVSFPSQIHLAGGDGDVDVALNVPAAHSTKGFEVRSVSARASFWSGFDSNQRVIVNRAELWDPRTTCYPVSPGAT